MSDIEAFYIPRLLDEPPKLLFWSADEAIIMLTPTGMGIILGYTLIGIILGLVTFLLWKKIKGKNQSNILIFLIYWLMPSFLINLKFTPPSYQRIYVG